MLNGDDGTACESDTIWMQQNISGSEILNYIPSIPVSVVTITEGLPSPTDVLAVT